MYFKKSDYRISTFLSFTLFILLFFFSSSINAREVTLTWEPNSEPDLSHYIVYWGVESGVYTSNSGNIGLITEYKINIPDGDQVYFFAVTAVDISGLESDFSNEVNTQTVVFYLEKGWNLISIPDISANISIEEAFGPIMNSIINIWSYENGIWRAYPSYTGYGSFTVIKPWQGLWINIENSDTISFTAKTYNSFYLSRGWNLVRFALPASQNIQDAISSIYGNVVSIWTYKEGKWRVYDPLNPYLSDLETLEPGPGYWIKVKNSCFWTH